jgi:hypothetical protein
MNRLAKEEQIRVVAALVEGNSIRAVVHMTGVAKNTVVKLLCDIGVACFEHHDKTGIFSGVSSGVSSFFVWLRLGALRCAGLNRNRLEMRACMLWCVSVRSSRLDLQSSRAIPTTWDTEQFQFQVSVSSKLARH